MKRTAVFGIGFAVGFTLAVYILDTIAEMEGKARVGAITTGTGIPVAK